MLTTLVATLTAALEAFTEASRDFRGFLSWYQKAQTEKWMQESNATFRPLEKGPTTPDEKNTAAQNIGDLIHKL